MPADDSGVSVWNGPFGSELMDPRRIKSAYAAFSADPEINKRNILAESFSRIANNHPVFGVTGDTIEQELPGVLPEVYGEAKLENFDRAGNWRRDTDTEGLRDANQYLRAKSDVLNEVITQKPAQFKTAITSRVGNFLDNIRFPNFIADPLALRSPVVMAGGPIESGSFVNPKAVEFLRDFKPVKEGNRTTYETPFGTQVNVGSANTGRHNLAFEGPFGYSRSGDVRAHINILRENAEAEMRNGNLDVANRLYEQINNAESKFNEPLRSPALRYTLGAALQDIPIEEAVTAHPIGEAAGSRARIYERMTNKALATKAAIRPDPNQTPSEQEFRAASQGEGMTFQELMERNRGAGTIFSQRTSPTTWLNINGQERTFDPASLKDEMIRAAYNLTNKTDVSHLRDNPLGPFQKTDRIDFTKPVITTESLPYRARGGINGALNVGAADFIPTPEAVRSFYSGRPLEGAMNIAGNFIGGIPQALAAGAAVTAAPALAPAAAGAGLGMTAIAASKALNEVSRQQTGEGLVPKFRQFIGTEPRTGLSSPPRTSTRPLTATVRPMTTDQRRVHNRQQGQSELTRRVALARSRFNPARGEFGLSEILFGR